jgi:uncharacterized protein YjbI with pentapeptide repeats
MSDAAQEFRYGESLGSQPSSGTDEVPVNPYSLLEAVNEASEFAHTTWIVFLVITGYLVIAIAGVEHQDLLLNAAVKLPILDVEIELTRFFLFVPVFLVLLHFGVLVQHVMVARKVLEFHAALRPLEQTDRRTHPLRLELHSYFFTQALAGPERSSILAAFLQGMVWATLIVLPALVILFVQVQFLPYHDIVTTWSHRVALVLDLTVLLILGVFLWRREASFWRAFWRVVRHHPIHFLFTAGLLVVVLLFSFLVATIPDEALDRFTRSLPGQSVTMSNRASVDGGERTVFALTALMFERASGLGIFHRNLIVNDVDLVRDKDNVAGETNLVFRSRDLRFASLERSDLHGADFTGADLEGASLVGADLRAARFGCTDVDAVNTGEKSRDDSCTRLVGANFSRSKLDGADLRHARLDGAQFIKASLDGVDLGRADLVGADFSEASLKGASFAPTSKLVGAKFFAANLEGANLFGAKLQGADFYDAGMQGVELRYAQAVGTSFEKARLDGADFTVAVLYGVNLSEATMKGADFSSASIGHSTPPPSEAVAIADLGTLKVRPLNNNEISQIRAQIEDIPLKSVRDELARNIDPLLREGVGEEWAQSSDARSWETLQAASVGDPALVENLTRFVSEQSCQARFADGAVARGLARRALANYYKGNVSALHQALSESSCPAAKAIPAELMVGLAAKAEERRETASLTEQP